MDLKTTIWYEFTDKGDVQALRDAADALERDGYVKLLLPNVELDDPPAAGGGAGSLGGSSGIAVGGSWAYGSASGAYGGSAAISAHAGAIGYAGGADMGDYHLATAKRVNRPVAIAGGGGGGEKAWSVWLFPDGHHERLLVGETPKWPKDNPVRDAIHANP